MSGYRLPSYDPRLRAGSAPVANAGPTASAEAFGAGQARDLYNFGGGLAQLGRTVSHIADIKQERIDMQTVRDLDTDMAKRYLNAERQWMTDRKGKDAIGMVEDGRKWFEDEKKAAEEKLTNNRQRDLFAKQFSSRLEGSINALDRYEFQEVERGNKISRDAQNDLFFNEVIARGLGNDDILNKNRELAHLNIAANHKGEGEEAISLAMRDYDRKLYSRMLEEHAAKNLDNALAFLDRDDVKAAFSEGEIKKRRDALVGAKKTTDLARDAKTVAESGLDAYDESLKYESEEDRQTFLRNYDDYQRRKSNADKAERVEYKDSLIQRFVGAGYSFDAMTQADRAAVMDDPEIYKEAMTLWNTRNEFRKFGKDAIPNFAELDGVLAKSRDDINAWMAQPENIAKLYLWDAGKNTDEFQDILKKRRGEQAGGSGHGGMGAGETNDFIKNAFPSFTGGQQYEEGNREHERLLSNYRVLLKDAVGAGDKKLSYDEWKDANYRLIDDIRLGVKKLDQSLYDVKRAATGAAGKEPVEISVSAANVPETVKMGGVTEDAVVRINPATNERQWFGEVDLDNPLPDKTIFLGDGSDLGGLVSTDSKNNALRANRIDKAYRAYQDGAWEGGLACSRGDIVGVRVNTDGSKTITVFDAGLNYKTMKTVGGASDATEKPESSPASSLSKNMGGYMGAKPPDRTMFMGHGTDLWGPVTTPPEKPEKTKNRAALAPKDMGAYMGARPPRSADSDQPEPPRDNRPDSLKRYLEMPDVQSVWNGKAWVVYIPHAGAVMIDPDGQETMI